MLLLLYLAPLPVSLWFIYRYLETLPKQAKLRAMHAWDDAPRWLVLGFALLSTTFALSAYGATSLAVLAVHTLFAAGCAALTLGPWLLAQSAMKGLTKSEAFAVGAAGRLLRSGNGSRGIGRGGRRRLGGAGRRGRTRAARPRRHVETREQHHRGQARSDRSHVVRPS